MLPRPRGAVLAVAAFLAAGALLSGGRVDAAGPTTYGITPSRGTATTGITATFSFKTTTAAACTSQQIRFFWDGAFWGSASASWIAGNGTCTGNATLVPPSGALPGTHQTTAADTSGHDTSTGAAAFLLLNPDGSTAAPSPTTPVGPSAGSGGTPVVPIVVVLVLASAAITAAVLVGRGRRSGPGRSRRA